MSDDLISRSALLAKMKQTSRYFAVKFDIEEAPTVDAVPVVHGRWIPKGYATFKNKFEEVQIPTFFKCSECGTVRTDKYKYCPNCGAKMDGGKDNGNDE